MRVLIQNCKTFDFLTAQMVWVKDEGGAVSFLSGVEACYFVINKSIQTAQLVYQFEDQTLDFTAPLSEDCP